MVDAALESLERSLWYAERVGISTRRALSGRIPASRAAAADHRATPSQKATDRAGVAHFEVNELVEKIEERILRDTVIGLAAGCQLRATRE